MDKIVFSIPDYIVFSMMLVISSAIGFFYAWKERKKKTTDQVLLGGRKLKVSVERRVSSVQANWD